MPQAARNGPAGRSRRKPHDTGRCDGRALVREACRLAVSDATVRPFESRLIVGDQPLFDR
jgi:hypothetical protein